MHQAFPRSQSENKPSCLLTAPNEEHHLPENFFHSSSSISPRPDRMPLSRPKIYPLGLQGYPQPCADNKLFFISRRAELAGPPKAIASSQPLSVKLFEAFAATCTPGAHPITPHLWPVVRPFAVARLVCRQPWSPKLDFPGPPCPLQFCNKSATGPSR
jgi:hypothetical protein